jgi:arylsulfatase
MSTIRNKQNSKEIQRGASFNLDAVKAEMAKRMQQAEAASKGPSQ